MEPYIGIQLIFRLFPTSALNGWDLQHSDSGISSVHIRQIAVQCPKELLEA
jgi:hypothetical protein